MSEGKAKNGRKAKIVNSFLDVTTFFFFPLWIQKSTDAPVWYSAAQSVSVAQLSNQTFNE